MCGTDPAQICLIRVGRLHDRVELAEGAKHLQEYPEADTQIAMLELGDRGATDAGPLGQLLRGEILQFPPGGDVLPYLARGAHRTCR